MAQPISNGSSKRHISVGGDSNIAGDDVRSMDREASVRGCNSPSQSRQLLAMGVAPSANSMLQQNDSRTPPSPAGKAGTTSSQPAFAPRPIPSARELRLRESAGQVREALHANDPLNGLKAVFESAREVRMVLPTFIPTMEESDSYLRICQQDWLAQIPLRDLELGLDPCAPGDSAGRLHQMAFVSAFLFGCRLANKHETGLNIHLDVPMGTRKMIFPSMEPLYSRSLYNAIADSKAVSSVRVKGYRSELDRTSWLTHDNELLGDNVNISRLELAECEFGDADVSALALALGRNNSIKVLVFNRCGMSASSVKELQNVLINRLDMSMVGFDFQQTGSLVRVGWQTRTAGGTET